MSQAAQRTRTGANIVQNKKIKQKVNYDVHFTDMLEVQNVRHKLCIARTALCKDKEVVAALRDDSSISAGSAQSSTPLGTQMAEQYKRELESQIDRSHNLLIRLDGATSLVSRSDIVPNSGETDCSDWEYIGLPRCSKGRKNGSTGAKRQ